MALTRVAPAGIGSTPGTGYVIGDSFLHSRGLNATDGYYTGIVTTQSLRVIGDFQVDGTTTTLDTVLTEVDKLEVGANNNTVGVAITQSGTGDIFNLYDGSTEVFSVRDGGNVGIKNATGLSEFPVDVGGEIASKNANKEFIGINLTNNEARIRSSFYSGASGAYRPITFYTSDTERLRITSAGKVGIGSTIPTDILDIQTGSSDEVTKFKVKTAGQLELTRNHASAPYIKTLMGSGNPNIILGDSAGDKVLINGDGSSYFNGGNVGIGTANPRYPLEVNSGNLLVSGSAAGNLILEDRGVGDSSRPFYVLQSDGGKFSIYRSNRNASGTTTSSVNSLTLSSSGNLGLGPQTNPTSNIHIADISANGYELKLSGNALQFNRSSNSYIDQVHDTGSILFRMTSTHKEAMRITSDGTIRQSGSNSALGQGDSVAKITQYTIDGTTPGGVGDVTTLETISATSNGSDYKFIITKREGSGGGSCFINLGGNSDGSISFGTNTSGSGTERLRITSGGGVGIGTDIPYVNNSFTSLSVGGSGKYGLIELNKSDGVAGSWIDVYGTSGNGDLRITTAGTSGAITFWTGGSFTEKVRIDSSGRLLIGRTSTSHEHPLQVQAAGGANAVAIQGRSVDDQSEITFYENDNSTILGQIQHLRTHSTYRHRVGYLRFDSGGYNEKMRLDANGYLGINNAAPHNQYYNNLVIGDGSAAGDKGITIRTQSSNEGVIAFSDADSGAARYAGKIAYNHGSNAMMFFTTNGDERLRIDSTGKTLIWGSLGPGNLPLGGNAASAALQIRGTTKYQGIAFGQSASNATIGIDNTKLVYTANANPANLGGGVQAAHEWWSGSSGGGGPSKIAEMNTSGQLYLGGYPLTHTVAGGSNLKLRAGTGAWGISIGMRSSQNDYAYIGFTDMNGTENIGDIFMQRTGTSTGHMVFSTNNGSGGSENRLRIGNSGRITISPDASFAAESTNIATTIVASGGDVGGYPGINIRSTASGGGTNSQNGMSIVSTDGHWSLYTNAGNVHGLGILAGNSANSGNTAFYVRSDKKITMGPQVNNEAHSTNTCGQAVHIAGGSLGIGAVSNYSSESGTGGRHVLGWYHANAFTNKGSNTHLHLVTSLWGGSGSNSEYMMGGFHIHGYRYNTSGVSEEIIYFHNWNGSLANYSRHHHGNWNPSNSAYVNSSGYVTIKLSAGPTNYHGYTIDLMTFNWYPVRDIHVTSTTFNTGANL